MAYDPKATHRYHVHIIMECLRDANQPETLAWFERYLYRNTNPNGDFPSS